jgi:flagellar assembly factor FliW
MLMTSSANRLESSAFLGDGEPEVIDTRFGKIQLRKHNPIVFPQGLLGMPDKFHFFLTDFPSENLQRFKLLQCLDDYKLSFITLPADLNNTIVTADDLAAAARDLKIVVENLVVLFIVSVHRVPGKVTLSVNARAPLLIDSGARLAAQHVFQTDKYKVQHPVIL